MMSRWTPTDLDAIGNAAELHVAPWASGATPRRPATVWVVRVGDDLFVRSYRGQGGVWYRTAQRSHRGRIRAGGVERDVAFEEAAFQDDFFQWGFEGDRDAEQQRNRFEFQPRKGFS